MLEHMKSNADMFICPSCGGSLRIAERIECVSCKRAYETEYGIPLLFLPREAEIDSQENVTEKVKQFYEKTPFPNYENFEHAGDLMQKARVGVFARLLDEQVPFHARVLDAGCGTGQLSNFLGIAQRSVFGTDMCVNSLKLAQDFRTKNNLDRVGFYQMNLFNPIFKNESFDLVICNGVLHHTPDPFSGFLSLSKLVKKGGYIIIGLYNAYGRLTTDFRRLLFALSGNYFTFLDSRLTRRDVSDVRKRTWFMDQYQNPHESKHTMGEVLRWFNKTGYEFVNGIPKLKAFTAFAENEKLFRQHPAGNRFDRFITQAILLLTGAKEGGFFVMIGKRK